jgi:hypothetical protein
MKFVKCEIAVDLQYCGTIGYFAIGYRDRRCERSEAIQSPSTETAWIASSLRSSQ